MRIYVEKDSLKPHRAHDTDAGLDLKAKDDYLIYHEKATLVCTGVYVEIPECYVGLLFPRSGLSIKSRIRLANSVGVIDSGYRGEIKAAMIATNKNEEKFIEAGTRVAQLVILPIIIPELKYVTKLEDLSDTIRGDGGFGHTGQ